MAITIIGDHDFDPVPSIKSKCLRINLNSNIYGTFNEIGAGQETVRNFFRAGGASGTIAKAMSAYDKDFSDAIYGVEKDGRYVTEKRLLTMLEKEMEHMEQRISREKHPKRLFFSYANTVATIDFAKKYKGHGWVGIRYQTDHNQTEYNEISLHVRFHENDARHQQHTLGILGVNLIYGAYYKHDNPKKLLKYLYDHIDKDKLEIDTINFSGPCFKGVDNRLMSLQLVKNGMTEAIMFGPDGNNILPARILYKKNILALRGSFRPVTKVNMDILEKSLEMFKNEPNVDPKKIQVIFEITLSNLMAEGEIDEKDFLDRARLLCNLGQTVLISNFKEYYRLVEYFSHYTREAQMALAMGVSNLIEIFNEKYYRHLSGGILEAFGKLFYKELKVYLYPLTSPDNGVINSDTLIVDEGVKELYKFFKHNGKVKDIENYNPDILNILSRVVFDKIKNRETDWEKHLPEGIPEIIKSKGLFGYRDVTIKDF